MSDYSNEKSGVLFKNDRKEKETHPDYKGSCEIEGQEYWISAWIKTGKEGSKRAGEKFMSLAFQVKESNGGSSTSTTTASNTVADDDQIPF